MSLFQRKSVLFDLVKSTGCLPVICLLALTVASASRCLAGTNRHIGLSEHKIISHGGAGVKGGIVNASSLTVNEADYDLSFAPSGGLFIWSRLPANWMLTSSLDLTNFKVLSVHEWFLDASLGLKKMLHVRSKRMVVMPGFAVGYGYWPDVGLIGASTYLTLKGGVDLLFLSSGRYGYLFEFSIMTAPTGGPIDASASINPAVILRFGVMF